MNRRAFLQMLAAVAAGVTLDPERLLWVPGQKTIFLPAVEEFSTLITPTWVTKDVARMFRNQLKLISAFDRTYDDMFKSEGFTIQVRSAAR